MDIIEEEGISYTEGEPDDERRLPEKILPPF